MSDSIVADGTPLGKMRGAGDAAGGAGFDAAASASRRFGGLRIIKKPAAAAPQKATRSNGMKGTSGTSGVATGVTHTGAWWCGV